jgi:hypothetical protein
LFGKREGVFTAKSTARARYDGDLALQYSHYKKISCRAVGARLVLDGLMPDGRCTLSQALCKRFSY